ncbi:MAG TPA: hypothetical protein PKE47_03280 [Verrucomicrobiota bacterium]|nr:hypothetical protein [Verrucomicrobiota bacterium]
MKSAGRKPRTPKPAEKPPKERPAATRALPDIVYDAERGDYWRQVPDGTYVRTKERDLARHLRLLDWSPDAPTETFKVSKLDALLVKTQNGGGVDHVLALAGHRPGVFRTQDGRRILVPRAPRPVRPQPGDFSDWDRFLEELLGPEAVQAFLGWLHCALTDLHGGEITRWRHNQMLVLAGPPRCGKSFLQTLITHLCGGREANPYRWMAGETTFNEDLAVAEHLGMAEVPPLTGNARRTFAGRVKELAVSTTLDVHPKGRSAVLLPTFRRITLSVNDDADYLAAVPSLDESMRDKVMLLACRPAAMLPDWKANLERFQRQAPAFVAAVLATPPATPDERFGAATWHDPRLLSLLADFEPHWKLNEILDAVLWKEAAADTELPPPLRTTATELQTRLLADPKWSGVARQILPHSSVVGVLLSKLEASMPTRFRCTRSQGRASWLLCPPPREA